VTWNEAKAVSDQIKAEAAAKGEPLYLWSDGVRAGAITSTVTQGYQTRIQGPPVDIGLRLYGGGL
jgi:hypothetical protein